MARKLKLTRPTCVTFLLVLFLVNRVSGVGSECKKGQIKMPDGKCVKKVEFFKIEKKSCPTPKVVNGEFELEGRMVEFRCHEDKEYILAPDVEFAMCKINLKTGREWSKPVPSCLLPGCVTPPHPQGGVVSMEFRDTVARFSCREGLRLEGEGVLGCEDGVNWNSSFPSCEKCSPPPAPEGGEVMLEEGGTKARFSCLEGFKLVGGEVVACVDGTKWSNQFPKCEKIMNVVTGPPVAVGVTASQAGNNSFSQILFMATLAICFVYSGNMILENHYVTVP